MVVYDVNDRGSFGGVDYWIKEISHYTGRNLRIIIVGNENEDDVVDECISIVFVVILYICCN